MEGYRAEQETYRWGKEMNARQSNIELLRLLSMFLIIIFHFVGHGISPQIQQFADSGINISNIVGHFILSFTITPVTVFVLISGYFGIHFRTKSIFSLYLRCTFWGTVSYFLAILFGDICFGKAVLGRFLPFTHGHWWFIEIYLFLYFISPVLNVSVDSMTQRQFSIALILLAIIVFYFGYCRECGDENWGTSSYHFICLYLLGRYINKYISIEFIRKHKSHWLLIFIFCSLMVFSLALLAQTHRFNIPSCLVAYAYNSPWIVCAATSLLLLFLSFSLENKKINWIAKSSLAGYLLQDSAYFGFLILYPFVREYASECGVFISYAWLLPFSTIFYITTLLIDKLVEFVIFTPSLKVFDRIEWLQKINVK